MTRIIIAESDPHSMQRLISAAESGGHDPQIMNSLEQVLQECEAESVPVVVIGPAFADELAFELAAHLVQHTDTRCVVAARGTDAQLLRAALRSGVTDVVDIADDLSEITAAIGRAAAEAEKRLSAVGGSTTEAEPSGKVITVFSTKGGVGKTVLATNLAVTLARAGLSTAIIDLDLEFGDVGIMMGIKPGHTVFDAVQAYDRLDTTMLMSLLEAHSSGAKVLLAPTRPEDAEGISAARVSNLIRMLSSMFDYVVVDTAPSFSEVVLAALDKSDRVFVMTMMDVASIKNTRISLQKLDQLGYDNGRVKLVLNRADSKVLLEVGEVEKAMTGPVVSHIPSDRVVPRSVNKGVPVVLDSPKSSPAKEISRLTKVTVDELGAKEATDDA